MTKIHIPPAALEAGARAICEMEYGACDGGGPAECNCTYWMAHARAAFEAMVKNWDGSFKSRSGDYAMLRLSDALILPLMENPDAEA